MEWLLAASIIVNILYSIVIFVLWGQVADLQDELDLMDEDEDVVSYARRLG